MIGNYVAVRTCSACGIERSVAVVGIITDLDGVGGLEILGEFDGEGDRAVVAIVAVDRGRNSGDPHLVARNSYYLLVTALLSILELDDIVTSNKLTNRVIIEVTCGRYIGSVARRVGEYAFVGSGSPPPLEAAIAALDAIDSDSAILATIIARYSIVNNNIIWLSYGDGGSCSVAGSNGHGVASVDADSVVAMIARDDGESVRAMVSGDTLGLGGFSAYVGRGERVYRIAISVVGNSLEGVGMSGLTTEAYRQ